MSQFKYPAIAAHPPQYLQKIVGGAQWIRPLNQIKITEIMLMKSHNNQMLIIIPKKPTRKDVNNATDNDNQKTPENSQNTPLQKEPINTRGEKYNLRPNPNPNYSDTYRY